MYYVLERNNGNGWYDQCISDQPLSDWEILYTGYSVEECQQALWYDLET